MSGRPGVDTLRLPAAGRRVADTAPRWAAPEPNRGLSDAECWRLLATHRDVRVALPGGMVPATLSARAIGGMLLVDVPSSDASSGAIAVCRTIMLEAGGQSNAGGWSVIVVAVVETVAPGSGSEGLRAVLKVRTVDGIAFAPDSVRGLAADPT